MVILRNYVRGISRKVFPYFWWTVIPKRCIQISFSCLCVFFFGVIRIKATIRFVYITRNIHITFMFVLDVGQFEKLRKATDSFVISACPSVYLSVCLHGTPRLHWTDVHKIWYWKISRKSCEKIKILLKWGKSDVYLGEGLCTLTIMSLWIILRTNVSDRVVWKVKTHIFYQ